MRPRVTLSVGNFFYAISFTLVGYILLPYLSTFMSESRASLVVAGSSLISLILFLRLPRIVERVGAQSLAIWISVAQMLALFALAAHPDALGASIFIAGLIALQPFLSYTLDLLLEATVEKEGVTGRVRTLFLTAYNIAEFGTPLLMGSILDNTDAYARIFLAAAAALVPFIVIFASRPLPERRALTHVKARETIRMMAKSRDLTAVSAAHFFLYLFYVWAPLYVPVYLHDTLGMPWSELGWMFSVMLIPFVLVEYPAGVVADKILGDKELMVTGFIIMGGALAAFSLITPASSAIFIVSLLFISRIGAALVESMTEAHFFRRAAANADVIAVYRMLWPLADVIAPLIGSALLFINGFHGLFLVTGIFLVVAGTASALAIRDFR